MVIQVVRDRPGTAGGRRLPESAVVSDVFDARPERILTSPQER